MAERTLGITAKHFELAAAWKRFQSAAGLVAPPAALGRLCEEDVAAALEAGSFFPTYAKLANISNASLLAPEEEATEKVSVTLDRAAVRAAKDLVGPGSFSKFLSEALKEKLHRTGILSLLQEMDEEFGPVPSELIERARAAWRESS